MTVPRLARRDKVILQGRGRHGAESLAPGKKTPVVRALFPVAPVTAVKGVGLPDSPFARWRTVGASARPTSGSPLRCASLRTRLVRTTRNWQHVAPLPPSPPHLVTLSPCHPLP